MNMTLEQEINAAAAAFAETITALVHRRIRDVIDAASGIASPPPPPPRRGGSTVMLAPQPTRAKGESALPW